MSGSHIYTIAPTESFMDKIADGLITQTADKPETLSEYLILLPTRRGCRTLQDAFLRKSNGVPIMLPRLHPIGDIDGEELFISGHKNMNDIPPAMPSIKRQILLGELIGKGNFSKTPEANMKLASALGQLMDQIYTEGLDIKNLPYIIDRDEFANHWQVTLDFLEILSLHWPDILKEHGMIDAADRRNRLIYALHAHWESAPPSHPVIAAGSTGSIPATTKLLKTISTLPKGQVILPGLDKHMTDKAWGLVEEGHPQNTLKELLDNLNCNRHDVHYWGADLKKKTTENKNLVKEKFISHVMSPPDDTHEWGKISLTENDKKDLKQTLQNIHRVDCDTPQHEADVISIILRETLEDKNKTVALITPNRYLARRVSSACKRWGIDVDDSAGVPLNETAIGSYLSLIIDLIIHNIRPIPLLSLLKHDLCKGAGFKAFRGTVREMDSQVLRGLKPPKGFEGLKQHYHKKLLDNHSYIQPNENILLLIQHLESVLSPLIKLNGQRNNSFIKILKTHIAVAEELAQSNINEEHSNLWTGDAGESAANFLSDIQIHVENITCDSLESYMALLGHFMKTVTVRPKFGTHPRVSVLGQLEARLIQADRVILAGLNEGVWPPDPGHDPWMSRPMRVNFGLPKPERAITLAAHDFTQGFCSGNVFLTRSKREEGTPTVPARWLQRIDTFMQAVGLDPNQLHKSPYLDYARQMNNVAETKAIERPAPTPPKDTRPSSLSVTKIEKWMRDPYAIYAEQILKLRPIDPLEKTIGPAERGNILHQALEKFIQKYPKDIPNDAESDFIQITRDILTENNFEPSEWNFWIPRIKTLSNWLIHQEINWRQNARFLKSEAKGSTILKEGLDSPFTLSARVDRIDSLNTGGTAIIDYKSGGTYSIKKIETGETPQLPLEALIVHNGGFENINNTVSYIGYWKITGSHREAGKITAIDDDIKLEKIINETQAGLTNLVQTFQDDTVPYLAIPRLDNHPPFNDYEHLERVKEWSALDEATEDAA